MSKTKEYSSDVLQNIVEPHKIERSCKKITKALKIPISNFRAMIKQFIQLKMFQICLEGDIVFIILIH